MQAKWDDHVLYRNDNCLATNGHFKCQTHHCSGDTCRYVYRPDGPCLNQNKGTYVSAFTYRCQYHVLPCASSIFQLGETGMRQFDKELVVCPPKMRGEVLTTAAVDNTDYKPSSTTGLTMPAGSSSFL